MKKTKILIGLLLLCFLLMGNYHFEAKAEEDERYSAEVTYVNPLYAGLISEDELNVKAPVYFSTREVEYQETIADAAGIVRDRMEERADTITVGIKYDEWTEKVARYVFDEALTHTGVPTEGDYLMFTYGGWGGRLEGYSDGSTYYIIITYNVEYYTTAEQEAELNTAVEELLAELDLDEADDYGKVCGIYDYMCDNITYDYDNLNDDSHLLKYTAYAALVNGTSVCQGYANLFYRLALELDVDARIIAGDAGGPHSWNIVQLDNEYYNLDATWDASYREAGLAYAYFLQNQEGFADHIRNDEYDTTLFHTVYPMSEYDYSDRPEEEPIVAVYQDGELLGKSASFESAFSMVTDENKTYLFEIIGEVDDTYYLPEGEWPEAELLEFAYEGNEENAESYYVVSLAFTGNVYLNSDVKFSDMSLDCALENYVTGNIPTLYARAYTMYFSGNGNYLGGSSVIVSEEEVYQMGLQIEGSDATLVSEASDRFEMRASDVRIGTVNMNNWFLVRGGSFVAESLILSENVSEMSLSSFYNEEIAFDVEYMEVRAEIFSIHNEYPNENNTYCIGNLHQKEGYLSPVTIFTETGTGLKMQSAITVENFEELVYIVTYKDTSDYTREELENLYSEAVNEGDGSKANFYTELLWNMTYMERYPVESPDEIMTYEGTLLNIGTSDLENLEVYYTVKKDYLQDYSCSVTAFLEVDAEGNVSRAKDEFIVIEDGVLINAGTFGVDKVTLNIPNDVTSIASFMLSDCVDKVVIPASVERIADYALTYNYAGEFVVDENNPEYTVIDGVLYTKDMDKIVAFPIAKQGEFTLPATVSEIADNVFASTNLKLTKLTIPSSVEVINSLQFQGNRCEEIEVDCRMVYDLTFINTSCLKNIVFGSNVEMIGNEVLLYSSVDSIHVLNPDAELYENAFASIQSDSITVYGYEGSTAEEYVKNYGQEQGLVFSAVEVIPEETLEIPAKPHKIANVVSGVHVYWKAVEGAEKYGVWRSENGKNGTYKWLGNPQVTHFTDTKVKSGKTYYYKITAMDPITKEHTDKSEAIGITYVSTPDLTQRYNKAAGVVLEWNRIDGAMGYAIYRKNFDGNDAWKRIATIEGNDTFKWTDASVKSENGTVYRYTIRALAGSDMKTLSGCRNTGRTMVRLTSRVLNSAETVGDTSVKCSWTTTKQATGYEVRFMVGSKVYKTITIGNYKTGTKTFTGLEPGTTYKIQVRSYRKVEGVGSFYSAWSEPKYVETDFE